MLGQLRALGSHPVHSVDVAEAFDLLQVFSAEPVLQLHVERRVDLQNDVLA